MYQIASLSHTSLHVHPGYHRSHHPIQIFHHVPIHVLGMTDRRIHISFFGGEMIFRFRDRVRIIDSRRYRLRSPAISGREIRKEFWAQARRRDSEWHRAFPEKKELPLQTPVLPDLKHKRSILFQDACARRKASPEISGTQSKEKFLPFTTHSENYSSTLRAWPDFLRISQGIIPKILRADDYRLLPLWICLPQSVIFQ